MSANTAHALTAGWLDPIRRPVMAALAVLPLVAGGVQAQDAFPDEAVTIIVPYGPGTGTDSLARRLAAAMPALPQLNGQPVIVENRAGANGFIGAELVAGSEPDGYTLILATDHIMCYNPALFADLRYDPVADFAPVAGLTSHPHILVVGPGVEARSVPDLVTAAKADPGGLTFGSTGVGTAAHLVGELFQHEAGIELTHVPYPGGTQLFADVMNGTVSMAFYPYQLLKPFLDDGRLFALGNASEERAPWLPDLPTMPELGYPQTVMSAWLAVYAPAGTPEDRIAVLSDATLTALKSPEITNALTELGIDVRPRTPAELGDWTVSQIDRCKAVVELSGARAN